MKNSASAHWEGSLKNGTGKLNTNSKVLKNVPYDFKTRFEGDEGTNPEELIAAAHAGCFSMALSMVLGDHDLTAERIDTDAVVTLEEVDDGFAVKSSHLTVKAKVPGASDEAFAKSAEAAKNGCPISKLLNAEITMDATLEN